MTLADEILAVLRDNPQGVSDADLSARLRKLHQHVNQTCTRLAAQGRIERDASSRPILNRWIDPAGVAPLLPPTRSSEQLRPVSTANRAASGRQRYAGEIIAWAGRDFTLVGPLDIERDPAGELREFMPQSRYAEAGTRTLNRYGAGPFCRFRLPGAPRRPGVYVLSQDRSPVYTGICEDLARRWGPMGYASISPANCDIGGQPTNCKINTRVLEGAHAGRVHEVWFHPAAVGLRATEIETIRVLATPWNGTR